MVPILTDMYLGIIFVLVLQLQLLENKYMVPACFRNRLRSILIMCCWIEVFLNVNMFWRKCNAGI